MKKYTLLLIIYIIVVVIIGFKRIKTRIGSRKGRNSLVENSDFANQNKDLIERIMRENIIPRNKHLLTVALIIGLIGLVLFFSVYFIFKNISILAPISALLMFIGLIIIIILNINYQRNFKKNVLDKIIKAYNSNYEYYPYDGIDVHEYEICRFPEVCDIYTSEDLIVDTSSTFRYADVLIKSESEDNEGNHTTSIEYSGSIARIDVIDCQCEIFLGGMKRDSLFDKKYQKIKFENDKFNDLFSAYASSELNAYKILTPDVMEQFVHLKENTYGDIDIRILHNRLYIRFLSGDGFVPSLLNKKREMNSIISSLAVLEEVVSVLNTVKNLIEKNMN